MSLLIWKNLSGNQLEKDPAILDIDPFYSMQKGEERKAK